MNKNDQQFMAEKIRTQYVEKQSTELDELRALDAKVKRPANVFGYTFGSISAIVMARILPIRILKHWQTAEKSFVSVRAGRRRRKMRKRLSARSKISKGKRQRLG